MDRDLQLRWQVCFALYSASRTVTNFHRPVLEKLGLTYPQYLVLLVLWEQGSSTVKELGAELMLDSGTLSPLLKRMEATGLVRRERSTRDERSVEVHLTPRGDSLRREAAAVPATVSAATGMSPRELSALRESLIALTRAVAAASQNPPGSETE
jgi:DNA-binding MarR family transcriptional regulator